MTTPSSTTLGSCDDQDRMLAYGNNTYSYTANGELVSKTSSVGNLVTSYQYDVRGALLSVDLSNDVACSSISTGTGDCYWQGEGCLASR